MFVLSAQNNPDCYVKKKRSVKLMKKLNQNLRHYSFYEVKMLSNIQKLKCYLEDKESENLHLF